MKQNSIHVILQVGENKVQIQPPSFIATGSQNVKFNKLSLINT